MAKRVMRAFKMNEISAVDRPAQAHARALIMKRDDGQDAIVSKIEKFFKADFAKDMYGVSRFADLIQSIDYLAQSCEGEREREGDNSQVPAALRNWLKAGTSVFRDMADEEVRELVAAVVGKRDFSAAARRKDVKSGAAMADGSFPIENAEDLSNAMRLAGHAKDPSAARAHIRSRANALGLESKLSGAYSKGIIDTAKAALLKSIESTDDPAHVAESIKQFKEHLNGMLPAELVKAALAEGDVQNGEDDMTAEEIKKAIDDAVATATADLKKGVDELKAENLTLKVAGMKEKHKAFYADLNEQEKEDFLAMSEGERDKKVGADPDKQEDMPPKAKKMLDETIAKAAAQDVIIKQLLEDKEVMAFAKKAVGLGLEEAHGEVLRKAYAGDKDAIVKLESLLKGLSEQVRTGKVFAEFGATGGNAPATAKAEMDAKADEYIKANAGKKISKAQAFTAVYTDPAHADLKKRYDAEEIAKRRVA